MSRLRIATPPDRLRAGAALHIRGIRAAGGAVDGRDRLTVRGRRGGAGAGGHIARCRRPSPVRGGLLATALLSAVACLGCAQRSGPSGDVNPQTIRDRLERCPVGPDEALRPETLRVDRGFSIHLLQFRTGEQRHIHRAHDLTFIVHRGQGQVWVGEQRWVARPGDVFHIPRGTPHACVNTGVDPLVCVLIFTPPFDPTDSVPAAP